MIVFVKNLKSNKTRILDQSRQSKWIFFLDEKLEQPLKYQRFHLLYGLYHCNDKLHFPFNTLRYSLANSPTML